MTNVLYGVFCEDEPQSIFIDNFLSKRNSQEIKFIKDQKFYSDFKPGRSKGIVKSKYLDVLKTAITQYKLDLCIIGFDMDCDDRNKFKDEYEKFTLIVSNISYNKSILFIPVQCIEHWLYYLLNENLKKGSIENRKCSLIKKEIYGKTKLSSNTAKQITHNITKDIDFSKLLTKSYSFNKFYNDLHNFVESHN